MDSQEHGKEKVAPSGAPGIRTWDASDWVAYRGTTVEDLDATETSDAATLVLPAMHTATSDLGVWDTAPMPVVPAAPVSIPNPHSGKSIIRSAVSLIVREGLLRIMMLAANVFLARLLSPSIFGIFVVLTFFNSFLSTFGTFGLGAALVQRKEEPEHSELSALFTFQFVIALALVVVAFVVAPVLSSTYHFGEQGIWLIRSMAISFLLTSAGSVPVALMERHLAFGRIAIIEVINGFVFQALAVLLAWRGFSIWSLVVATLASSICSFIASYMAGGWWPRLSFRFRMIWPIVRFGMQYQVNGIISLLKDNISPTFVVAVVGAAAVGFINWAATLAYYPLIVTDLIGRVMFPAFSRVVHDRKQLQHMVESTIRVHCYVVLPMAVALGALAPYITHVVFTDKWMPAVPLIYYMLVSTFISGISRPLIAAFNALGKPNVVSRLMILWFVLDWGLIVPLVLWQGFVGYAMANALVSFSIVVTVRLYKRYEPVRMIQSIAKPTIIAAVSGGAVFVYSRINPPDSLLLLAVDGLAVCVLYVGLEALLDRSFVSDVRFLISSFRARKQLSSTESMNA